jgi:hypothetical protein
MPISGNNWINALETLPPYSGRISASSYKFTISEKGFSLGSSCTLNASAFSFVIEYQFSGNNGSKHAFIA